MDNEKYSLYLNEVGKNLAALGNCSLRCSTTYIPVGDLDRSPFHLLRAFLPGWLTRGCSSVSNPFTGEKIHGTFSSIRFTRSYCYASADDQSTLFAIFPLSFVPFMQYAG